MELTKDDAASPPPPARWKRKLVHLGANLTLYSEYPGRHGFWRIGPQDCFLPPDVAVMVDALGPYCSSPRGHYYYRAMRR